MNTHGSLIHRSGHENISGSKTFEQNIMARILIIEDETDIASVLADDLRAEGHDAEVAADGESGLRRAREEKWDLLLLDVMLPRKDGLEVCRELRRFRIHTPIIMLTAKAQEAEKVLGLELGADDYVTKPFSPRELRARVKAMLRRSQENRLGTYRFGEVEVDFDRGELRRNDRRVDATPLEFKLLSAFLRRRGRVLSREQLIDEAWGRDIYVTDRVVDSHIVNLRRKIEPEPTAPRYLISVRGIGYRFDG
jgi:two-component system alkaline phosphatase synthesis response regulator PhoP